MKNKILTTIQDIHDDINDYLIYNAQLAEDYNLKMELVASSPVVTTEPVPTAIVGGGTPEPIGFHRETIDRLNEQRLSKYVEMLKNIHADVDYNISLGLLENRIHEEDLKADAIFWCINQKSSDNYFNQLFGTLETTLSKQISLPVLIIPESCKYQTPKTLLMVIRDTIDFDINRIDELTKVLGLDVLYAFQEDNRELNMEKIMSDLNMSLEDYEGKIKFFTELEGSNSIDKLIEEMKPDWISFSNYDRSIFERISKTNTNELILSSNLPVLNF